jgi:hypothetical protein
MKIRATKMKFTALLALMTLLSPGAAMAQLASTRNTPVQPDPVPGQGANYAPSDATATTAYMGPARDDLHNDCTEFNPCALPSSAPHPLGQLGDLSK